jgi:hypothetical protein
MKYKLCLSAVLVAFGAIALVGNQLRAQAKEAPQQASFAERNLGGPRLGVTYALGNSTLVDKLKKRGIGTFISQFGWHFEYQVIPEGGGPSFVIQGVPFLGGVEYGTVIPSGTLIMGIRLPDGIEFGMGPNVIAGTEGVSTSLVLGVGKSINYGGVSIPLNIAWATSKDGNRISFVFGYAIAR